MAKSENNVISIIAHILGLLTWVIGPVIVYLASDDKKVKSHAKIVLNWQISFTIYMIISGILALVLIGFVLIPILSILNLVFSIIGAIKASEGTVWRYPLSIPFMKA